MAHAQKHLHHELSAHKQSWQIKYFQEEVVHKLSNCLGDFLDNCLLFRMIPLKMCRNILILILDTYTWYIFWLDIVLDIFTGASQ